MNRPTDSEYALAKKRADDANLAGGDDERDAYWQVCRWYQGRIFHRPQAEYALTLIRGVTKR